MLFEGAKRTGFISFSFNSHFFFPFYTGSEESRHLTLDKIDTVY